MKSAYVTLLNDDDHPDFLYCLILAFSIKKTHTKHDIVLLYTLDVPHYKLELLSNFYTHLIRVEHVQSLKKRFKRSLSYFFTKFQVFNLVQYAKVLYLDKYQYVNQNLDYLFLMNTPSTFCYKNKFKRSHMFLIKPDKSIYEKALTYIDDADLNKKYIDKDILNKLFKKIYCFSGNLDFQKIIQTNKNISIENVKIIDYNFIIKPFKFVGKKDVFNDPEFKKYKQFYLLWYKSFNHLYTKLKKRNIDLTNIYSVILHNYKKFLKIQHPNLTKSKLSPHQIKLLQTKLDEAISEYYTFQDIINIFIKHKVPLFIYGGSIRDLFINSEIRDVDFYYMGYYKDIYSILKSIPNLEFKQGLFKKYFNIENDEMELSNFDILRPTLDAPCNGLLFDLSTHELYDLTGYSKEDAKNKIWRKRKDITFEQWSKNINNLIYRLVKFLDKGFKIPASDRKNIYKELYYVQKDRTYWFFLSSSKYDNDAFYDTIKKDVDSLNLEFTGDELVQVMKKNINDIKKIVNNKTIKPIEKNINKRVKKNKIKSIKK